MHERPKIVVAEEQQLIREALIHLLKKTPGIGKCIECGGSDLLPDVVNNHAPHLLVYGLHEGASDLQKLKKINPNLKILMLTQNNQGHYNMADNTVVMSRSTNAKEFVKTIINMTAGKKQFEKREGYTLKDANEKSICKLTGREADVIFLVCQGKSNKEIANALNVVVKTIDYHKANIYRKTKTYTAAGLVNYAIKNELLQNSMHI